MVIIIAKKRISNDLHPESPTFGVLILGDMSFLITVFHLKPSIPNL